MIKNLLCSARYGGEYNQIVNDVCGGIPTAVFGVTFSEKCRIVSSFNQPVLYVVRDIITAKKAVSEIKEITGKEAVVLYPKDDTLLFKSAFDKESLYRRLTSLYKIASGVKITVTTFEALMQLFPKKIDCLDFDAGCDYDLFSIPEKLVKLGYKRVETCEFQGEFSLRGDTLTVFPINEDSTFRLDFFGDNLERIKSKGEERKKVSIIATTDCVINPSEVESIKERLKKSLKKYGNLIVGEKAKALYDKIVDKLESDLFDPSLQYILPLIENKTDDFTEYFSKDTAVVFDESKITGESLYYHYKEHVERVDSILRTGEGLDFIKEAVSSDERVKELLCNFNQLAVQTLTAKVPFFNPLKTYNLRTTPVSRYFLRSDDLVTDVKAWSISGYTVVICCGDYMNAEKVYYKLLEAKIPVKFLDKIDGDTSGIVVTTLTLDAGFICHDSSLAVIGTGDLFVKKSQGKTVKRKRGDLFTAPEVGGFAVHERFGVGLVKGVKRINTVEGGKDYVELEYAGGDRLYVSTDQMDRLTKYLGGSETPTLNKIGNGEFERIKERVKLAIAKMTVNLKKLYHERATIKGYAFSEDNALTAEFDNAFGFEETEDQITSMQEIKEDMESSKVMDRLLCGDVGFGKTEVAFRACFKAIMDGKQVAMIAPTTILSEQHYLTAVQRFEGFGVRIGVLNRFKTPKQQKALITAIENGEVDFVIGTHRLFSKDIKFKDLGLLIVDEEQRFGVEHKEKLKLIKENVDTLVLSATPIPRTLHMSLSGIRDISTINTPPKQRIPVQTVVAELTDSLISDALKRELSRNGQAFILYNRVEDIYLFADKVRNIVPTARIIVAHGQMPEKELENSVMAFYNGEADVLIATTIIENGIDVPRANTLIVESSDRLGLSTLYQLKGRVGRSNLMAYAYFTYTEGKILTDASYKRLSALMEYTEMGSGYKIAMRDLEIRGAGNVLGKEQHGHLDRVGYELYSKLLKEELGEVTKNAELELDIKADAYIPESYIESEKTRMDVYKQIAEIVTQKDKERVLKFLNEEFGAPPKALLTLIDIAVLKVKATEFDAIKLTVSLNVARLTLKNLQSLKDGRITNRLKDYKNLVTLTFDERPVLVFNVEDGKPQDEISAMIEFLTF